ncbi:MAG: LPS export ABC transporter periplasmic protein LptC [Candidatus Cloacimonadales bacterium]|nr:LPS export ABC transporter periplasmic protein LptC [Candidatus Cloacimonadales bacterium]
MPSKFLKCFVLLIFVSILSCTSQDEEQIMPIEGKIPDEEADSIMVVATTNDRLDYEMTAVHMYKYYDTKQTFVDTVFVTFYNDDGTVKSTLRSDKAEMDDAANTITGIGNVVVISDNGTMKAPYAVLNKNTEQIFAQKGVTMIRGENTLYGEEMVSDMRLDRVEITKVSAEGKLDNEEIDW